MKIIATILLALAATAAHANQWTCIGPKPTGGTPVCICDAYGWNCNWITVGR